MIPQVTSNHTRLSYTQRPSAVMDEPVRYTPRLDEALCVECDKPRQRDSLCRGVCVECRAMEFKRTYGRGVK